jgi:hypothetical protein
MTSGLNKADNMCENDAVTGDYHAIAIQILTKCTDILEDVKIKATGTDILLLTVS